MGSKPKYGCLMLTDQIYDWNEQASFIDQNDIIDHPHKAEKVPGIEDECHVTILYGFHQENDVDYIKQVIDEFTKKSIQIELTDISCFSNEEYDVIKYDVSSDILHQMNAALKYYCPFTSNFPEYHPHMTIAYVKKGEGEKYCKTFDEPIKMTLGTLKYSDPNKVKTSWEIGEKFGRLPTFEEFLNS